MKEVNWDHKQTDEQFFGQFGHSVVGLTKEQLGQLELAIQNAANDIERGNNPFDNEFDLMAAYISGCFENNFNL